MWAGLLFAKRSKPEVEEEDSLELKKTYYESDVTPEINADDENNVSLL